MLRTFTAVVAATLISGCAMSPMTIAVHPSIDVDSLPIGRQQTLAISTIDQRSSNVLGNRGGVYNTAYIATASNFTQTVNEQLTHTFRRLDFNIQPVGNTATQVQFVITELKYQQPPHQLGGPLEITAKLTVNAYKNQQSFSGHYASSRAATVALAATQQQNQQLINQTVSQVLSNAVKDPKLQRFLSQ